MGTRTFKSDMRLLIGIFAVAVVVIVVVIVASRMSAPRAEQILAAYQDDAEYGGLTISYPLDGVLFPPEIVPPTFRWKDSNPQSNVWLITIEFQDDAERLNALTRACEWTPKPSQWKAIKKRSLQKQAKITILGVNRSAPEQILSGHRISISTSKDEVGAPLFYREVNLPFIDAVKDPSRIRWRFGLISSPRRPPVVLQNLPVCGNCHSFPRDGRTLAMDVDYANRKGSYVMAPVAQQMVLATSDIITWDDYRKDEGASTFGLLSQISPDGRFVVSTVKDQSVFVPKPDLAFSQLFFPVKGILCVYDRREKTFKALPGADDPQYVQSNPSWSPDGKYIVFARAKAYDIEALGEGREKVLLSPEDCREFLEEGKTFLFDLYKIPFNGGKGGTPQPIEGASHNGMSNFFARFSPDGKWIVFCKAKSYMLLQPDSELYIVGAEGGQARRLECNQSRMNSWHSWSPNGKWLVFSSKAYSDYTQLLLTHIDEQGRSTPPVLLSRLTAPDRAANIPEFVDIEPDAIAMIREQFVDDSSFFRAAKEFVKGNDLDNALRACKKALKLNPENALAHNMLAHVLKSKGMPAEATPHLIEAVRLDPHYTEARYNLGLAMIDEGQLDQAAAHFRKVLDADPNHVMAHADLAAVLLLRRKSAEAVAHLSQAVRIDPNYADAYYNLAQAALQQEKPDAAIGYLNRVIEIEPKDARAHYKLALICALKGQTDQALTHHSQAVSIKPEIDTSALLHHVLARNYARARRFHDAVLCERKALQLARAAKDKPFAREIEKALASYRQLDTSADSK